MIKIKNSNSYMSLDAWVMANVVQLWTDHFCSRFLGSDPRYRYMSVSRIPGQPDNQPGFVQYDPTDRQFDQMTQAARSGVANIAEGSALKTIINKTKV